MVLVGAIRSEKSRFAAYVEGLATVIGHKDRVGPLRDYCTGLMLPCERKSVEPMAAVTAPARTAAQHQSLLHFVGEGGWSDERVLGKVREIVLPAIERQGSVEAWIIDDTGFPKQGRHSVGVARQYCAASSVSRTIVRWRCRSRWPIGMRACRWLGGSICRPSGRPTARGGARHMCRSRLSLRPSRRLRLSNCTGPARPACRAGWFCSMPAMAITASCAPTSRRWT